MLPALRRVTGLGNQKSSQNEHMNSFLRLRAERGITSNVHRFDDAFPLTDIDITENHLDVGSLSFSMSNNAETIPSEVNVSAKPVMDAKKERTAVSST